jgi:alpha-N-arabinofuranosidase
MANLRRENGREKPWKVKYLGVGNESWGCGGDMQPEFYADQYRRYAVYCRNFDGNQLFKIASGASDYDYNWTEVLMKNVGHRMQGLSLHYYTIKDWSNKGSATDFSAEDYYWILGKGLEIEEVIKKHIAIMDKYDLHKNIALLVDEWGTWFDVEPETNPGFLYQQNTMRDAFVAALSLNIFNKYSDRISMANIAQIANVLQSMILTKDGKMILTPTYHVFEMYKVHQDATYLPLEILSDTKEIRGRNVPLVSASASRKDGVIHITMANIDLDTDQSVVIDLPGIKTSKVSGRILTSAKINDCNTFDKPDTIKPETLKDVKISNGKLTVKLPAKAIAVLEIR